MKPSLLIGRIAGTEIRLHWTMMLIIPYVMLNFKPQSVLEGIRGFLLIGLVFFSVLLHELGHLLVARGFGVRVSSVVLWILGGAAVTEREPEDPRAQLFIAGAGPLVNLLVSAFLMVLVAAGGALSILKPGLIPRFPDIFPFYNLTFIIITNLILGLSNLLPIYPLDGGRIFKALVQMFVGPARSAQVTFWISLVLGIAVLVWGLASRNWLVGLTALLLLGGALTLNNGVVLSAMRLYARLSQRPDIYIRISDFDPAAEILSRMIDAAPKDPGLYLQRAYVSYFLEDFSRSLADADRSLALLPGNLQAIMLRGALYYALNQPLEAMECAEQAERIKPGWVMVNLNRAILLRDVGRLLEALEQVNTALSSAGGDPALRSPVLPLLTRSSIYYQMGDHASARRDWEEALRLNARETTVFSPDRVRIFARSWEWAEAFMVWLQRNAPDHSILPVAYGEVALRAGQFTRAVEQFGEAIRRYPSLRDLCYFRGLAYQELGERERAKDDFRMAQQVSRRAHIRRLASFHLRVLTEG